MTETVSMIERREAIESAIAMVEAAYEDCAAWCEHLACGTGAGLPDLDEKGRLIAEIVLNEVAVSIRSKASAARRAMMDYAGEPLQ